MAALSLYWFFSIFAVLAAIVEDEDDTPTKLYCFMFSIVGGWVFLPIFVGIVLKKKLDGETNE
jgi:hypothetical protein